MDSRWSLWTGGLAARNYIKDARRQLRDLGVLVPASLRAFTAALQLVVTALVGVTGCVLGILAGVAAFLLIKDSLVSGSLMPLPEAAAFLATFFATFLVCVRVGHVVLLLVYRGALRKLAALERSGAVSSSASVAIPGSGGVSAG